MFTRSIPIVKIEFEGSDIPPARVQQAHATILKELHDRQRDDANEYVLDQSKLIRGLGYFMIVFDRDIRKVTAILRDKTRDKNPIHFYHEREDYDLFPMSIEYFKPHESLIGTTDTIHFYQLFNWCPLDESGHKHFKEILQGNDFDWKNSFYEQRRFLEDLLRKHLYGFISSFHLPIRLEDIACGFRTLKKDRKNRIIRHFESKTKEVKEHAMWGFSGEFACNLLIPEFTGIGRHPRYNNGVVRKIRFDQ